jgi:quinol monooxygenase YgiN
MNSSSFRNLTDYERSLIGRLLEEDFAGRATLASQIEEALVRQLDEHGCLEFSVKRDIVVRQLDEHGCLEFSVKRDIVANVKDRIPTEGEFKDTDGVAIHVLLHVVKGKVDELEIYKDDGSPVVRMPDPAGLRLFHPA